MAKVKRYTQADKKRMAKMRKELKERGIIPPDKPKLNRKKFIEEARQEWNDRGEGCYVWDLYLRKAIGTMLGATDKHFRASPEAVGVAKVLKLAIRLKAFDDKLKAEDRTTYTVVEQYEFIKDIIDA